MKKFLLAFVLCVVMHAAFAQQPSNVAYEDARVRFTVIADGVIRMEYAPDGKFVDAKSLLAVEREYAPVDCRVRTGGWIELSTSRMTLRYKRGSGPFSAANLQIRSAAGADVPFVWRPGQKQTGNLKGTARTLDGFDGDELAFGYVAPYGPGCNSKTDCSPPTAGRCSTTRKTTCSTAIRNGSGSKNDPRTEARIGISWPMDTTTNRH